MPVEHRAAGVESEDLYVFHAPASQELAKNIISSQFNFSPDVIGVDSISRYKG
jgi:hypothetical protein